MANSSSTITEAIDKIRGDSASGGGGGVVDALNRIGDVLTTLLAVNIDYPKIANGPVEQILGFNNNEIIGLEGPDDAPYFSSHGPLTDLFGNVLKDSRVATTFPVDPEKFGETDTWPSEQVEPFDAPPLDETNTTGHGYSKQAYFFNNDKDCLVTVGPSLPKIARVKGGAAQFWVASIGVVTQGTGIYQGARGMSVYIGSGYLPNWPETFPEQVKILRAGFVALVGTYFKLVLKDSLRPAPPPPPPPGGGYAPQSPTRGRQPIPR